MAGYIERITGIIPHTNKSVDIPLNGKNLIDKRLANIAEAKTAQGLKAEIEENKKVYHNQNVGTNLDSIF